MTCVLFSAFTLLQVLENSVFAFTQPAPLWRHVIVTVVIVVLSVGASMATDCLGFVLELNVSTRSHAYRRLVKCIPVPIRGPMSN